MPLRQVLLGQPGKERFGNKLAQVFSGGVGVGTGFVIDSTGNVSKQQDIILYEKSFCPVYRINDLDEVAYYPCEGVFAVGEVKSTIGSVRT